LSFSPDLTSWSWNLAGIRFVKFGAKFVTFFRRSYFHRIFVWMNVPEENIVRLSQLPTGRRAVIKSHDESDFQLTLMEMGCVPGEPVWVEVIAPMGDPMAIQIAGYYLSIRKQDADKIWVTAL
jgi:ferrous iron transport protein A